MKETALVSYWAVISARFRSLLQYRSAALAGLVTQIVWGMIRVMIFQAFYSSTTTEQPMSGRDVETYIWLGQAFLAALPWNIDTDLRALIRSGGIGYELVRPVDLHSYWMSRALAWRTAPMLMRSIPLLVFASIVMGMAPPASLAAGAAFVVSMCAAIVLSSAITTFLNVTMLWTITGDGIAQLTFGLVLIFSGMLVPLPLFPDWTQPLINAMPFRGLVDTPYRLYLGHIPASELPQHLAHQLFWIVAFVVAGRIAMSRALRRVVVQGG